MCVCHNWDAGGDAADAATSSYGRQQPKNKNKKIGKYVAVVVVVVLSATLSPLR